MIEVVFISDLHLNANEPDITERFKCFVKWAVMNVKTVYILGDFFHVWSGDDAADEFSNAIAKELRQLHDNHISVFYMHGNRDFLLGKQFARRACITILPDPTVIELHGERILLTHGDGYCKQDKAHQWLMWLTRNRLFISFFLLFPSQLRKKIVERVRHYSQENVQKPLTKMAITPSAMLAEMQKMQAKTVIHGHIHQPGLTSYTIQKNVYKQYVLSDWDDKPSILCYYKASRFAFLSI